MKEGIRLMFKYHRTAAIFLILALITSALSFGYSIFPIITIMQFDILAIILLLIATILVI